jgi:hypothetical protein
MGLFSSGDDFAREEARRAREEEQVRRNRLEEGTNRIRSIFQQFTPAYYSSLRTNAENYYQPQLDLQYQDAVKALQYSLARQGLLSSSARAQQFANLERTSDQARQEIANRATNLAKQRQSDVEAARATTMNQLYATEDPVYAGEVATQQALAQNRPPEYSPLGQIFQSATGTLATQADLERAGQAYFNTGWFGNRTRSPGGAVRYTRG